MNIFYDIEVFRYDVMVVFLDVEGNTLDIFHQTPKKRGFMIGKYGCLRDVVSGNTLIGYNNYHYDDYILTALLSNATNERVKHVNDEIIAGNGKALPVSSMIFSLDCYQQIAANPISLKAIEANMGVSIEESGVPFDIDRPLTMAEVSDTIGYCRYDVLQTIKVYKMRERSYFRAKKALVDLAKPKSHKWNTTTIGAYYLTGGRKLPKWATVRGLMDGVVPQEVMDLWLEANKFSDIKKQKVFVHDFGCKFDFGFGGLHGVPVANKGMGDWKNVKLLDVTSLYPNIIVHLNVLGVYTGKYESLLKKRTEIKHVDKELSSALKLILNSTYGNLKNKYSILNNPRAAYTVCFYGQSVLYDLCRSLYRCGCELINVNTDGVAFVCPDDRYKEVQKEWEEKYDFSLELSEFSRWVQRDVNNYVAATLDGEAKVKGELKGYAEDNVFGNNSCRIVPMAVVDRLLFQVDPLRTLTSNLNNPMLYQYNLKVGKTFAGIVEKGEHGRLYQKNNRVFACRESHPNKVQLVKLKADGSYCLFPDAPVNMFVWNRDCKDLKNLKDIYDLNYYYQLCRKKLNQWGVVI